MTKQDYKDMLALSNFEQESHSVKNKLELFPIIKKYYKYIEADILKARSNGNSYCPYGLDFFRFATPIETELWHYIRCHGLPFLPEYPVLNYFIDFADPYLKIGIEADGKQWHDKEKDSMRDNELKKIGWKIYRIEGSKILKSFDGLPNADDLQIEWDEIDYRYEYENFEDFRNSRMNELSYFENYGAGIMEKISRLHYSKKIHIV